MRREDDRFATKNRLPSLPTGTRDACTDRPTLHEFLAVAADAPCVQGEDACVVTWVLLPDLVAWCSFVAAPVLGPAWTIEILHRGDCARGGR